MNKFLSMMLAVGMLLSSTFAFAEDVYATKNGKRYHKADCLLIKDKGAKVISLEDAQKKGLKPCRRCFGSGTTDTASNVQNQAVIAKVDAPAVNGASPVTAQLTK